ncbi:aldo/keto reductase, partial [Kitasatospora sp. NPDC093558]
AGCDALALAAAAAQPWADLVLSGAATPAQLASNLTAVDHPVTPEDLAALAVLAEPAGEFWRTRSGLAWS